jgi:hypothetical protein
MNAAMSGGVGPMRSNGRNYGGGMNGGGGAGGYRTQGPYQRDPRRGRMPSMSGGRPVMGMMEGGVGAMGPNEAVAGRSLRSYEDLDADKGETTELNY